MALTSIAKLWPSSTDHSEAGTLSRVPGAIVLALQDRWVAAIALVIWGLLIVGGIDNIIRPWVYRRYAQIHPFITVIGALAGIKYFGILGLLIGPLAISYFFELIRMYREEYLPREPVEVEPEPMAAPRRRRLSWPTFSRPPE